MENRHKYSDSKEEYTFVAITAEEMQEAIADNLASSIARIIYSQMMLNKEENTLLTMNVKSEKELK
jgi:hypothetical protein